MDKNNINKISQTQDDKLLLAKIYDKINIGIKRDIPANTPFLSPRELNMARFLFGNMEGLREFGGYEDAERKMLIYTPGYLDAEFNIPFECIRASFHESNSPSHRDFLGALISCGINRECIGDICVSKTFCDFLATKEISEFILQNLESAGRTKLTLKRIPLQEMIVPEPEKQLICESIASLRLDNIVSAGFHISRADAIDAITGGRVAVDGMPCEKTDKIIQPTTIITVRGLGKIKFECVNGNTRKGRISVNINRYI